jgi:uracil-DNA glycosylase
MVDNQNLWQEHYDELIACRRCPRLVAWREEVARTRRRAFIDWQYWGRPVPGFGDRQARLLVVGLAPAAHGANRTGRSFTGDSSGDFLYRALHKAGFASQPTSRSIDDGLKLQDVYIAAVARCAPPENRPTPTELDNCRPFLEKEFEMLPDLKLVVALGQIAFDGVLRVLRNRGSEIPRLRFAHTACYEPGGGLPAILASYHPSRQNTQTGRLTEAMFDQVWTKARGILDRENP